MCACGPSAGEAEAGGSLNLNWTSLVECVRSGFIERVCLKKNVWREFEEDTNISLWPPDSIAHVCRYIHGHTHACACSTHREENTSRSTEMYLLELRTYKMFSKQDHYASE